MVTQPVSEQRVGQFICEIHNCAAVQAMVSANVVAGGLPTVGHDHAEERGK